MKAWKILTLFLTLALRLNSGCSKSLSNDINEMIFKCGSGYDSRKSYIIIDSPSTLGGFNALQANGQSHPITEKGCLERPSGSEIFVTNLTQSEGVWVGADSSEKVSLQPLQSVRLPSTCESVIQSGGKSFDLKFRGLGISPARKLQDVEVRLLKKNDDLIEQWPVVSISESIHFEFSNLKSIETEEYKLSVMITDNLTKVHSKTECVLRMDPTDLLVSPADNIKESRRYYGHEVLIVDPGYETNFYVHDGFRDLAIEFCLKPISLKQITNLADSSLADCDLPQNFLNSKPQKLAEGFWVMNFSAKRGSVSSKKQTVILLVEKLCIENFYDPRILAEKKCTAVRGDVKFLGSASPVEAPFDSKEEAWRLDPRLLSNLDLVGKIYGNLEITGYKSNLENVLPHLTEVIGDVSIGNPPENDPNFKGFAARPNMLHTFRGLSNLSEVYGSVSIYSPSISVLDAFQRLENVNDSLNLSLPNIGPTLAFRKLQFVGSDILIISSSIDDFRTFSNLEKVQNLTVRHNTPILNFQGLEKLKSLENLILESLPRLESFQGLGTSLEMLKLKDIQSLTSIRDLNISKVGILEIDNLRSLQNVVGSNSHFSISRQFILFGDTQLQEIDDSVFSEKMERVKIFISNLKSLKGFNRVKSIRSLELDKLPDLQITGPVFPSLEHVDDFKMASLGDYPISFEQLKFVGKLSFGGLRYEKGILDFTHCSSIENIGILEINDAEEVRGTIKNCYFPSEIIFSKVTNDQPFESLVGMDSIQHLTLLDATFQNMEKLFFLDKIGSLSIGLGNGNKDLKWLKNLNLKNFLHIFAMSPDSSIRPDTDFAGLGDIKEIGGAVYLNKSVCIPSTTLELLSKKSMNKSPKVLVGFEQTVVPNVFSNDPKPCDKGNW